jgi:3-keto-5-aminohexanoate cleavage enzyme
MQGLKVSVRLRMSFHDAHYAGELVDGARMLGLFGDLATELLIRLDGDEGLFRAYDSVEFLAPVFAGDYIEATAELVQVGNTSRKMVFEARKVISNVRAPGMPASAADVLPEPVVVCRASGTCVTPKNMQRAPKALGPVSLPAASAPKALGASHPVIITAAIVGAELSRKDTPFLPVTAEEVAAEAARCVAAGASVIHLHARNDDGSNTQSQARFAELINAIRKRCDCIIQVTTGGAVGMSIAERAGPLGCAPEMATLNCGSVNFGPDVFVNTRPQIRELAEKIGAAKIIPELECYDVAHIEEALGLAREGVLQGTLHFQFVLGVSGAIPARETHVEYMRSLLPDGATWGIAAVGRYQKPMSEYAIVNGGHVRVGLEDNIYLEKGVLAEGSAPLVARAAAFAASRGRPVATVAEARRILLG